MHLTTAFLLLPFLTSTALGQVPHQRGKANPRSIDAVLVEFEEPETSSLSPFPNRMDISNAIRNTPFIKHLDLRQVAPAPAAAPVAGTQQQAAQPAANAGANANANANAAKPPANQQAAQADTKAAQADTKAAQADPKADTKAAQADAKAAAGADQKVAAPVPPAAPGVAPVAGVGGGGGAAPLQPKPGAQANPVTTAEIETVVGGVTKMVPTVYTQTFAGGVQAPSVKSGSIGMGTLTGKIGVVKTDQAKSDALPIIAGPGRMGTTLGIIGGWIMTMMVGGAFLGMGLA